MTKKENRRYVVRRTRRALNRGADVGNKVSGYRLHKQNYGQGLTRSRIKTVRERIEDES